MRWRRERDGAAKGPDREPALALLTADEIRALHRRALEAISAEEEISSWGDDEETRARSSERVGGALEAVRFASVAAGLLRDPSLLPLIAEGLALFEHYDHHTEEHDTAIGLAIMSLLRAGAEIGTEVEALASHGDAGVRECVASGLLPGDPAARRLLERLAADGSAEVRTAARDRLKGVGEVAWWKGKFAEDPFIRLGPEEALRLGHAIRALAELADSPRFEVAKAVPEILKLAGELPVPLGVEAVEHFVAGQGLWGSGDARPLAAWMLAREGGREAFLRTLERWQKSSRAHRVADEAIGALALLPAAERAAICRDLMERACAMPQSGRIEQQGIAAVFAEVAGKAWPPDVDATPVLDACLAATERDARELDWVSAGLDSLFDRDDIDPTPWLDRAVEAKLAGWPGPWGRFGHRVDHAIERLEKGRLRPIVDRAVASEIPKVFLWGLERWLLHVHDPARDPDKSELVRRLFELPKVRAAIRESDTILRCFLPAVRGELAAGRLGFGEAARVMEAIAGLYGSCAERFVEELYSPEERREKRDEARERLAGLLGPEESQGPPTEDEWRAYRRVRGPEHFEDDRDWVRALHTFPEGPWHPEDRAFVDQAIARWRGGDEEIDIFLGHALSVNPLPSDLGVLEEMGKRARADDQGRFRTYRRRAMDVLGIERAEPAEASGEGNEAAEEDAPPGEAEDDLDEWPDDDGDDDDDEDD